MKTRHFQLKHLHLALFAAAMLFAVPAAHAFTIDSKSMTNSDGSPKFTDPDETIEQFGSGSSPAQPDSGRFHFEAKPLFGSDQRGWINPVPSAGALRDNP
jgi:hypothetical protein